MKLTAKTGDVVAAAMVGKEHTVVMISSGGQVIRMPAAQISRIGRATQGVTLMRLKNNELVVSMAAVEPKSEADDPLAVISQNGHSSDLAV